MKTTTRTTTKTTTTNHLLFGTVGREPLYPTGDKVAFRANELAKEEGGMAPFEDLAGMEDNEFGGYDLFYDSGAVTRHLIGGDTHWVCLFFGEGWKELVERATDEVVAQERDAEAGCGIGLTG